MFFAVSYQISIFRCFWCYVSFREKLSTHIWVVVFTTQVVRNNNKQHPRPKDHYPVDERFKAWIPDLEQCHKQDFFTKKDLRNRSKYTRNHLRSIPDLCDNWGVSHNVCCCDTKKTSSSLLDLANDREQKIEPKKQLQLHVVRTHDGTVPHLVGGSWRCNTFASCWPLDGGWNPYFMGPYKPLLLAWVDEFIPYYMEIMGV